MRHFLDLSDAGGDAIAAMINDAQDRKAARAPTGPRGKPDADAPLAGHVLGMIFEKKLDPHPGQFRHRDAATWRQRADPRSGNQPVGKGESIADTARVLSRMVDAIMIRTDDHEKARKWRAMPAFP